MNEKTLFFVAVNEDGTVVSTREEFGPSPSAVSLPEKEGKRLLQTKGLKLISIDKKNYYTFEKNEPQITFLDCKYKEESSGIIYYEASSFKF